MNTENYYARHPWHSINFYNVPAARRVMDYLIENTTSYPRYVDGRFLPPGRIITTRRRICHDLGITLRDLVNAINALDLRQLITRRSYTDSIDITITLHPDELTPPPTAVEISSTNEPTPLEVGAQYIAPAQPALTTPTPPPAHPLPTHPAVGAQYIAPARPALTPPNPPSMTAKQCCLLNGSGQRPRQKPHGGDNIIGTRVSPCKSTIKRTSRVSGDIFIREGVNPLAPPRTFQNPEPPPHPKQPLPLDRPIKSPSNPRRGDIVFPSKITSPIRGAPRRAP